MQADNQWIIPGTSLKGAIRSRAERIAKTINPDPKQAQELINRLFGIVATDENEDEKGKQDVRIKGKVRIREIVLPEVDYPAKIQTRIKIDRFTGGAIDGNLLETMPLFSGKDCPHFKLEIIVCGCRKEEAGLLLLVLKDLWSGDLAIGGEKNVGRGVLKGLQAIIHYEGEKLIIPEDIRQIDKAHESTLQDLVEELNKCAKTV